MNGSSHVKWGFKKSNYTVFGVRELSYKTWFTIRHQELKLCLLLTLKTRTWANIFKWIF